MFGVKYRSESSDLRGAKWKVDILEDDFSGDITSLIAGGTPIKFFFDNNSDDVFDPIRETHVDISVYSTTNFALQDLYSLDLQQFKVNIYCDESLVFSGWIETQNYEEVYEPPPYLVTITATCGLSNLSFIKFDDDGEYYEGRQYESQVVLDILDKIGFEEFNEYVNVYEDNLDSTVDDSPFDQILVDVDIFREYNCLDVLIELLKKKKAVIRQWEGVFNIYRPIELTGSTVFGRNFTAYDTKTSITISPDQYIKRTNYDTYHIQVPGGKVMIQPPYRDVYLYQDYGNLDSWIKNHNFNAETINGITLTGLNFDDWINYGNPLPYPTGYIVPGENEGMVLPYCATPDTNYVYQNFGHHAVESETDMFAFEFDYLLYNTNVITSVAVQIKIEISNGPDYLIEIDDEECEWDTSGYISIIENAVVGKTGWTNWKRTFVGIGDGPFQIKIYPLYNGDANVWVGIKNVRFYCSSTDLVRTPVRTKKKKRNRDRRTNFQYIYDWETSYEMVEIKEKNYSSHNDIYGLSVSEDFLLGDVVDTEIDNITEQFEGSLLRGTMTKQSRVDEIILTTDTGSGQALITCNGSSATVVWNTSLAQTALDFINNHNSDFPGVNVSTGGDGIIRFTHATAGVEFIGPTTIENTIFDLSGYVSQTQPSLSSATFYPTQSWSTRSGNESKSLLQLIADEMTSMYSRPKQLIQMPVYETSKALNFNILGNFQDPVNTYSGAMRLFAFNRGVFDVRRRKWEADLFEIGTGEVPLTTVIKYGYLYNWYAASEIDYLIAADGWHVPTNSDFSTLKTYLGGYDAAGGKLKETGTTYWADPNTGATNETGFNGRGAGERTEGSFGFIKNLLFLQSSDEQTLGSFYGMVLADDNDWATQFEGNSISKNQGYSVRLIKDSTTLSNGETGTYTGNDGKVYNTICIGTQEWLSENLAETKYRDGTSIPNVTDNAAWAALTTGAYCAYDNDETNALETVSPIASATADSSLITVDSDIITVDSTI